MRAFNSIFILCATLVISLSSQAQATLIDKVVAVVGDNIILQSDIESQYQQMQASSPDQQPLPADQRCVIFDNLLLDKLFLSQAQIDSVTATPEEIDAELDRRIKYFINLFTSKEKLEAYYGKPIIELKDDFKDDIEKQLITDKVKSKVFSGLKVSPQEVKDFYERIPKDSVPYFNSELELGEIVMFPKVSKAMKDYAYEKIKQLREDILKGTDFSVTAIINSNDDGSSRDGGNLGLVERGEMVPEFESVIFKLREGEVSDIFETPFGYHIAIVDEIRGEKRKVRHILIKPRILPSDKALVRARMDSIQHLLQVDSMKWGDAVAKFSDDEQSKNIGGLMTNNKTGTSFFEKADIDGTLIFNLDRMKVGEYSDVLAYSAADRTGETKEGFRVIWLKSETKPHKATLDQDYTKIQTAAKAEKQQKMLEQWLKLHKNRSYIRIDDSMKSCSQIQKWLETQQ